MRNLLHYLQAEYMNFIFQKKNYFLNILQIVAKNIKAFVNIDFDNHLKNCI